MLTEIAIRNFRALRSLRIPLSSFQVLVGPNACGKSTFFDAIAFVRDILLFGLEAAVFGNPRMSLAMRASDARDLSWNRLGETIEIAISAAVPASIPDLRSLGHGLRYELAIDVQKLSFQSETLWLCPENEETESSAEQRTLFPSDQGPSERVIHPSRPGWKKLVAKTETGNDYFRSETSKWNNLFRLGPQKSALANLPEDETRFPLST